MTSDIALEPAGDGIYVVRAAGELDLYTAPDLKAGILNAVGAGARGVVVDLTETTFIDSTALGVLLRGVQRLRPTGGRLLVVCADANITKIFQITGLDRVFPIYDTRDAALRQAALA